MTEQELYDGISQRDNDTFLFLYNSYKDKIINLVKRNNGTEDDAMDIFQEGLIALWTNIKKGKVSVSNDSRIGTYLYAICRNIWLSKLRKTRDVHFVSEESSHELPDDSENMSEYYEQIKVLEYLLTQLSEHCRKLLQLFYYQKASIREIADKLNIVEKSAKNSKYRCMQNLRTLFKAQNSRL